MERLQLPNALKRYKHKLFGLTIDPDPHRDSQRAQAQQSLRQLRPVREFEGTRGRKPVPPRKHRLHQLTHFSVGDFRKRSSSKRRGTALK